LGQHVLLPLAAAVKGDAPWNTFEELIDYAKKNPGKVRVDTIGIGSPAHFNLEIIQSLTGAKFTHVPFKGGESVITAILGGHIEVTIDAVNKIWPQVESKQMKILLLSTKMADFPKVPTITELGYKQGLVSTWFAVYTQAGLPEDVKKILIPATEKAINNPASKAKIENMKLVVEYKAPADMKKKVIEAYAAALEIANKVGLLKK